MFKSPFSFEGRIRRLEFGLTWLIYWMLFFFIKVASLAGASFLLLLFIPMIWVMLAQGCKRCHDLGKSGFWQIIPFYFLFMIFQQGDEDANEYGYSPRNSEEMKRMDLESEIQSIGGKAE